MSPNWTTIITFIFRKILIIPPLKIHRQFMIVRDNIPGQKKHTE